MFVVDDEFERFGAQFTTESGEGRIRTGCFSLLGQIELDEAPVIEGYIPPEFEGKSLPKELRHKVVEYLFSRDL